MPLREEFAALSSLLTFELGEDMDEFGESVPEAIAAFVQTPDPERNAQLLRDMDAFSSRFQDCLEEAFLRWFGRDVPSVKKLFDMIRAIVNDPDCYKQFE